MRNAVLCTMAVVLMGATSVSLAQDPCVFDFDHQARAWAKAWPDTETVGWTTSPVSAHASYEQYGDTSFAHGFLEAGTYPTGIWIDTDVYASGSGAGVPDSGVELAGTFSIRGPEAVTFFADVTETAVFPGTGTEGDDWTLQIWDMAAPQTILVELDRSQLTAETTLSGNTDYGISLVQTASTGISTGLELDVELTAVPEPATMSLLAIGTAAFLRRRK